MIDKPLQQIGSQLQAKKPHMPHFLTEIHVQGIRGIQDLRVPFDYPVSVIAGGNASGKSTVLFVAACAYRVPGTGVKDFVPSTLFKDYRPGTSEREDSRGETTLDFNYVTPEGQRAMRWRRSKGWNRSYFGRKGVEQPQRPVYLRTLSNLGNPSEVRGVPSMSRADSPPRVRPMTAAQIAFAQQMLPFNYGEVVNLSSGHKNLLFATQQSGTAYSELHMSAGERALLRLSQEILQLEDGLVLIDEVEAGLHPRVQRLLMLHLQQLALRRNLQIIVTSHSQVVLDSVPANGRIFLDRDAAGRVTTFPPWRDIIQNALYGQSNATLKLLCEDEAAESCLRGVLDYLNPRLGIKGESIHIGRDTGAREFPAHARAFSKFGQLANFVFVLDGDQQNSGIDEKIRGAADGRDVPILFLPGESGPEAWVWERLRPGHDNSELLLTEVAQVLGTGADDVVEEMRKLDAVYESASDSPAEIAKAKLQALAERGHRNSADICRVVARTGSGNAQGDLQILVDNLQDTIERWRADMP